MPFNSVESQNWLMSRHPHLKSNKNEVPYGLDVTNPNFYHYPTANVQSKALPQLTLYSIFDFLNNYEMFTDAIEYENNDADQTNRLLYQIRTKLIYKNN